MGKPDLWEHQKKAIDIAALRHEFGFFFEMGTGKTRTMIETLMVIFQRAHAPLSTLILCPKSVIQNWKEEFRMYSDLPTDSIIPLTGSGAKRLETFKQKLATPGPKIFITNFNGLQMTALYAALGRWNPSVLIVDEAHRLKTFNAKMTKLAIGIADKTYFRFILTGTPITNSMLDIFAQFRLLDLGKTFGTNFYSFRNTYFYNKNAGNSFMDWPDWKEKPSARKAISDAIAKKAMYVKKSECLDLPPLLKKKIYVELSSEQLRHYKEMKAHLITFLNDKACTAQLALTKALRLQQIISGFLKLEDETESSYKTTPRKEALQELLEDLLQDEKRKVIVWACWRENYKQIRDVCEKLKVEYVELTGETPDGQRQGAIDAFNNDLKIRVFIGNQGASGIGINLTSSDCAIYFSRNFSLEQDMQSEARNYRGGSEKHENVTRIDLVAKDTIDEQVLDCLAKKQEIGESVLRNMLGV